MTFSCKEWSLLYNSGRFDGRKWVSSHKKTLEVDIFKFLEICPNSSLFQICFSLSCKTILCFPLGDFSLGLCYI